MHTQRRRILFRYLPLWIIVFSLMIYFLFSIFKPTTVLLQKTVPAVIVQTQSLKKGLQKRNLLLYGTIKSTQQSTISSQVNTVVDAIKVRDGDRVQQGQLLIQLSQASARLNLQQAKADLQDKQAQLQLKKISLVSQQQSLLHQNDILQITTRQLQRLEILSKKQVISAEALDKQRSAEKSQKLILKSAQREVAILEQQIKQTQASLMSAKAKLQDAENQLGYTNIVAPFNGVITEMHAAKGEHVNVGVPLCEVMSLDDIELRALIPSNQLSKLTRVQHHELSATATWHNHVYQLKFARLSGQVQTGHIGVEAIFSVVNGQQDLARGQVMLVSLSLPSVKDSYSIPLSALYGNDKVYIIRDNRLLRQNIKIVGHYYHSPKSADLIVVGPKLKNGDQLLVNQLPSAVDGLKVKARLG